MEPTAFDPLSPLRDMLVNDAGGYLRTSTTAGTCPACRGVSGVVGQALCPTCQRLNASRAIDDLGVMVYATKGTQSGALMYRYKSSPPPPGSTRTMRLLVGYNVLRHLPCVARSTGSRPVTWARVPSLRRPGPHPLEAIYEPLLSVLGVTRVDLAATSHELSARRRFDPGLFRSASPVTGHVLLLDDTWVTGNHLYSAAASLRSAGASRVTALVVARWLDPAWGDTPNLLKRLVGIAFDPDVCPFTGHICPR